VDVHDNENSDMDSANGREVDNGSVTVNKGGDRDMDDFEEDGN
jgi:hypothetical protein